MTRFTLADLEHANATWRCNCGPAALAAICDLTLDEVRAHFPNFPGYTNPTLMLNALRSTGRKWSAMQRGFGGAPLPWPKYGLARIQWEMPTGVPDRALYRYTHWVGAMHDPTRSRTLRIWDVNALGDGSDWRPLDGWVPMPGWVGLASQLIRDIPRATGKWHVTHSIEVER